MISPDGGNTKLALFTGTPQGQRETAGFHLVAFRVGAEAFFEFLKRLPSLSLIDHHGRLVTTDLMADHDSAFSLYFNDPYGHRLASTVSRANQKYTESDFPVRFRTTTDGFIR